MPRFIDPTTDIAFKKLFANQSRTEIVISFLNCVLGRTGDSTLVSVIINDPANKADGPADKSSIVDARCTDQKGRQYIIEMQVERQKHFPQRAQYYVAHALTSQLSRASIYQQIVPVIFVGVMDFTLFKNPDYLSHHLILDTKSYTQELNMSEYHFIELPKFKKKLEELSTDLEKWIYFLQYADKLKEIPENYQQDHSFESAFDVLNYGTLTEDEKEAYFFMVDSKRVAHDVRETAFEDGLAKGEKKGLVKGRAEGEKMGVEKGRAEGERQAKQSLARNFLALGVLSVEQIAQASGLTVEEVREIERQLKMGK